MFKNLQCLLVIFMMAITCMGCSTGNPSVPLLPDTQNVSKDIPDEKSVDASASNRTLWGIWQFQFNELTGEMIAEPLREAYAHFDGTALVQPPNCADCVQVNVISFDPITRVLDADVTLRNPVLVTGHDVRGILYTNDFGHALLNADDWTSLFDIAGGGTINPFRAFAKSVSKRAFAPAYVDTEKYILHIPIPAKWNKITYAVDASWPGNCKEPYSIENFTQEPLFNTGDGQALVTVDVLDWQNDVDTVSLSCNSITGVDSFPLSNISANTWGAYITNAAGAAMGDYQAMVTATSANSGVLALSDYFTITVTEAPPPTDMARTWGGVDYDAGWAVATDSSGNVYVTGAFTGTDIDLDPGSGTDLHTSNGLADVFLSKFNSSGDFQWARTWGGTDDDDEGYGVATDISGNVFVTGNFSDLDVDFDPGLGSDLHSTIGFDDVFLSKFNSGGDFFWARTWGGAADDDEGYGIATDMSGNVFVTGYFSNMDVDFDPGGGMDLHSTNGFDDAFISKFDSSGTFQWARTWGGADDKDKGWGLGTDGLGNVYVGGYFTDLNVNFNPAGSDLHSSNGWWDVFISKFNSNGDFQWARTWGGTDDDLGYALTSDGSGNVYISGTFYSADVDFDPGAGTDSHSSVGSSDAFVSKFNSAGDFQWAQTWGGADAKEKGWGVTSDGSGNVYVAGDFDSVVVDFDPGAGFDMHASNGLYDAFVSKFDPSGAFQWARTWGGIDDDAIYGVATDGTTNVYPAGWFYDTADFDPGPGVENHTSNGSDDAFLNRLPLGG